MQKANDLNFIKITFHKDRHLVDMLEITSEEYPMNYVSFSEGGSRGLQCSWIGDSPKHAQLLRLCEELDKITREINKLHENS